MGALLEFGVLGWCTVGGGKAQLQGSCSAWRRDHNSFFQGWGARATRWRVPMARLSAGEAGGGGAQRARNLGRSPEAVGLGCDSRALAKMEPAVLGGGEGRGGEQRRGERGERCAGELVTVCSEECNCPCDRGRRGRGARPASSLPLRRWRGAGFGQEGAERPEGWLAERRARPARALAAGAFPRSADRFLWRPGPFRRQPPLFLRVRPGRARGSQLRL